MHEINQMRNSESLCLTIKEAAKMCGVCENTFRILANRQNFPRIQIGRRILIPKQAFIEYINSGAISNRVANFMGR